MSGADCYHRDSWFEFPVSVIGYNDATLQRCLSCQIVCSRIIQYFVYGFASNFKSSKQPRARSQISIRFSNLIKPPDIKGNYA